MLALDSWHAHDCKEVWQSISKINQASGCFSLVGLTSFNIVGWMTEKALASQKHMPFIHGTSEGRKPEEK